MQEYFTSYIPTCGIWILSVFHCFVFVLSFILKYRLQIWGGSNPIFPRDTPKFGFDDGQKWGKKYMKREGNKLSIFKIEKIPIFSHDAPKFGFGNGKK